MTRLRLHLRSFAWLALVAMAALAFGPSVSRALGIEAIATGSLHATCVGQGSSTAVAMQIQMQMQMQMQMPDAEQRSDVPAPSHHSSNVLDCCALCAIAATPMAVLAFALPVWQPGLLPATALGTASDAVPEQRARWPGATPRGPPSLA